MLVHELLNTLINSEVEVIAHRRTMEQFINGTIERQTSYTSTQVTIKLLLNAGCSIVGTSIVTDQACQRRIGVNTLIATLGNRIAN